MLGKIDRVFLRGNEFRRATLLAQSQQLADILSRIPMMIAKAAGAGEHDPRRLQLGNKVLWTRNAAERQAWLLRLGSDHTAGHSPHLLGPEPQSISRHVISQHDGIGAPQRRERLAHPADGQQRISRVTGREQHDVKVARQSAMLEAIVEQVQQWTKSLLTQLPGSVAVLADDDGCSQLSRDQ